MNPVMRQVRKVAQACPPLINSYRRLREYCKADPLTTAIYRKVFDRNRLHLPLIELEKLCPASESIVFPIHYPLLAGEDTPLMDMMFLLNLAKGRQARRILEVGTYRARTTWALHLNCPEADIVSYDIQVKESRYRQATESSPRVQLRLGSFAEAGEVLLKEQPYDFIFIDGSHQIEHVLADSRLALKIMASNGIIIWHDYRSNDYHTPHLRVPEALDILRSEVPVFAVAHTTCAVHAKSIEAL